MNSDINNNNNNNNFLQISSSDSNLDIFGLLNYLCKSRKLDVQKYLLEELYNISIDQIEFVLPQLLCLYLSWNNTDIQHTLANVLIKQCEKSMHFGLKLIWLINAECGHLDGKSKKRESCTTLLELCESAIVNMSGIDNPDDKNDEDSLEQISEHLVDVPRDQRVIYLRKYLKHLTDYIAFGLYIPLGRSSSDHYRLLRIPERDAIALDSRDKAPFLLLLEVALTGKRCGDSNIYDDFHDAIPYNSDDDDENNSDDDDENNSDIELKNKSVNNTDKINYEKDNDNNKYKNANNDDDDNNNADNKLNNDKTNKNDKEDLDNNNTNNSNNNSNMENDNNNEENNDNNNIDNNNNNDNNNDNDNEDGNNNVNNNIDNHNDNNNKDENNSQKKNHDHYKENNNNSAKSTPSLRSVKACDTEALLMSDSELNLNVQEFYFDKELKRQMEVETLKVPTRGHNRDSLIYEGLQDTVWVEVTADDLPSFPNSPEDERRAASMPLSSTSTSTSRNRRSSTNVFGETWNNVMERMESTTPVHHLLSSHEKYSVRSVIFKGGDDLRQEALAMQVIVLLDQIFKSAQLPLRLHPFDILITSPESGVIETVPNAHSIHSIKKNVNNFKSLATFFFDSYPDFNTAQTHFIESMAAYSVVCYLLQIKDRHNGNILLNNEGDIIHIDFGFMLSNSPGGNINFESSPFKLTREYVEVMGGVDSETFSYFRMLVLRGFLEARKYMNAILTLVEIIYKSDASMPCFLAGDQAIIQLRERFMPNVNEQTVVESIMALIDESVDNWRSVEYDTYQRMTNGIL